MNADDLRTALGIPAIALVDLRVPKYLLAEHGSPTATDKRRIEDGIERIRWIASLKPANIGVREYRDDEREYLEIAILRLTLRDGAASERLVELVHRAIPYPVVLIAEHPRYLSLSFAHKRWSRSEKDAVVLEGSPVVAELTDKRAQPFVTLFTDALHINRQPTASLHALYQGWVDVVLAFHAAETTGAYTVPGSAEDRAARAIALGECERITKEIETLRNAAKREKQMPKRVELNLTIRNLQAEYERHRENL